MKSMATTQTVKSKTNGCVLQVVLNRPGKRNSFNPELIVELTKVFSKHAFEKGLRLIHLSGAGPSFSAGADLEWMKSSRNLNAQENYFDADRLFQMYQALQNCPIPIVTQVHGAVFGGGIGLCSGSDVVIADENSKFSLSETRRGLIPAVMMPFVIDKMGKSRTRELLTTGREFSAAQAESYGLVHFISNADSKDAITESIIDNIISCAPEAIVESRRLIQETGDLPFEAIRHELVSSLATKRAGVEAQEGLSAFFEKRKAAWADAQWSLD